MASWEDFSRIVAESKESKKLDPVGQEDDDVNNDGKVDDTDSYLKNRRASVGAAISADKKKKVEESKKLDPVGQEDDDIDNDGKKNTKNDKYLLNRRKVRSKIIQSKVTEDCGCEDSDKKENNSVKEIDPREMKTKVNLAKTKLRMLGLKMSYELEGEQIDEIAPLVVGGLALGAAALGGSAIKRSQDAAKSGVNAANKGQSVKPGIGIGNAAYGMQKRNNALNDAMKQLRQSYQPEGEIVEGKKKDSSYLETDMEKRRKNNEKSVEDMKKTKGYSDMVKSARKSMGVDEEFVGEDKEYRREMSKASARERAEERREKGGRSPKSPGREGPSAGKTYADYQELSIRAHDKVTKKNKNVVGLVTKEENETGEGYLQEKSLSRAQQRFMGMVYAAKKGEVPTSPEVAKAASGMSKKSAKDFAKTKHEGLPEKKEETKEEFSLVDVIITQFSPLNEAPGNTIPGGKRRSGLSKTIQSRQVDKLADEGDYERADKLQDVSSVKLKKNKPQPTASKSPEPEPEKKQERGSKKETAGKSTATERAARTTAASRIKAARIARETEKEKREYKEKIRQEKKTEQQAGSEDRRKSAEEKQQKLKELEKGKRADSAERSAQREYDVKQAKKERLRKQIGAATQIKGPDVVSSRESDAKAIGAVTQGAAQLAAIPFKLAGVALKNANLRRKQKQREEAGRKAKEKSLKDDSQNESFFNWREEFILEVDDQVVNPDKKKIIDVSKKKNNIEINPKIDEAAPLALLAPLAGKIVGGKVAAGITAKGAGMAAKGGLRQKAVEFAARKGGEMASSAVQNKLDPEGERSSDTTGTGISGMLSKLLPGEKRKIVDEAAAWTRSAGKNKSGGLNEKGRKSYEADNPGSDLKAPSKKVGNPRRKSFCARMSGMKAKLTSAKTARDPDSRINKSLRAWNC